MTVPDCGGSGEVNKQEWQCLNLAVFGGRHSTLECAGRAKRRRRFGCFWLEGVIATNPKRCRARACHRAPKTEWHLKEVRSGSDIRQMS